MPLCRMPGLCRSASKGCDHHLVNELQKRGQSLSEEGGGRAPEPRGGSGTNVGSEMEVPKWLFRLCTIYRKSRKASLYSSLLPLGIEYPARRPCWEIFIN
jgi:hypothetical protein